MKIDEIKWKYMYNHLFSFYPPPQSLMKNLKISINSIDYTFSSVGELLSFICVHELENGQLPDISYTLTDDTFKNYIETEVENIISIYEKRA